MGAFVVFQDVSKIYRTGKVSIQALHDVNFQIRQGEFCVIVGASGAGKDATWPSSPLWPWAWAFLRD